VRPVVSFLPRCPHLQQRKDVVGLQWPPLGSSSHRAWQTRAAAFSLHSSLLLSPPHSSGGGLAALADQVTSRVLAWIRATAFFPNSSSSSKNRPSPRINQNGTRPRGVCFAYNSAGAFCHKQNCRFRHKCSLCFRGHPRYKCKGLTTDPTTRPGLRADKLRTQHIPPTTPNLLTRGPYQPFHNSSSNSVDLSSQLTHVYC